MIIIIITYPFTHCPCLDLFWYHSVLILMTQSNVWNCSESFKFHRRDTKAIVSKSQYMDFRNINKS